MAGPSTIQNGQVPQGWVLGEGSGRQKWVIAIYPKLEVFQYFNSSLVVPVVPAVYGQEMG